MKKTPNLPLASLGITVEAMARESRVLVDGKVWITLKVVGNECHAIQPALTHLGHAVDWAHYYAGPRLEQARQDANEARRRKQAERARLRRYHRALYKE
jgi:hypothetical protein